MLLESLNIPLNVLNYIKRLLFGTGYVAVYGYGAAALNHRIRLFSVSYKTWLNSRTIV